MNKGAGVGRARIGQWYAHRDKGETFQVIGLDEDSQTVEVQTFDGDLDEIDQETWSALPLAFAAQPEDWTGPVDDVEREDLGYSETATTGVDGSESLRQLRAGEEFGSSRRTTAEQISEEDEDSQGEGTAIGAPALERPVVAQRVR